MLAHVAPAAVSRPNTLRFRLAAVPASVFGDRFPQKFCRRPILAARERLNSAVVRFCQVDGGFRSNVPHIWLPYMVWLCASTSKRPILAASF